MASMPMSRLGNNVDAFDKAARLHGRVGSATDGATQRRRCCDAAFQFGVCDDPGMHQQTELDCSHLGYTVSRGWVGAYLPSCLVRPILIFLCSNKFDCAPPARLFDICA